MAKTESEIIAAHKRTLEALTGKECMILLTSKEDQRLKKLSLTEIENAVQRHSLSPLKEKGNYRDLVDMRKIFCLIAFQAGKSYKQIAEHLQISHSLTRYYVRTAKDQLNEKLFGNKHALVKSELSKVAVEG